MSMRLIKRALYDHLASMPAGLIEVAWDGIRKSASQRNLNDDASVQAPYIRADFLPAQTPQSGQEIGDDAPVREVGNVQFTALYDISAGPGAAQQTADHITARFKWRQTLRAVDDQDASKWASVRIVTASQGRLTPDEGWLTIPVTVRWTAIRSGD